MLAYFETLAELGVVVAVIVWPSKAFVARKLATSR